MHGLDLDAVFEDGDEEHEPDPAPNAQILDAKSAQRLRHFVVHHLRQLKKGGDMGHDC